jgi:ankyrin repeat protein
MLRDDGERTALHWAAVVGLGEAVAPLLKTAVEEQERQLAAYKAAGVGGEGIIYVSPCYRHILTWPQVGV